MSLDHERIPLSLLVVERVEEEPLHLDSVLALPADRFLDGQLERFVQGVEDARDLHRVASRGGEQMDVPVVLAVADPEDVLTGGGRKVPSRERVVTVGESPRRVVIHRGVEELAAHAGVADEVDRTVRGPGGSVRLVQPVLVQDPVRAAGRRNQEDVPVEVGLEVGAGPRHEEDLGTVGGKLGAALGHRVVGQLQGVSATCVHDPDLALVAVVEKRGRRPRMGDPRPVTGEPEFQHREVARGDSFRIPGAFPGSGDAEQVPLLVILVEGEHVVPEVVLLLFLGGLGVGSDEVDVLAVR